MSKETMDYDLRRQATIESMRAILEQKKFVGNQNDTYSFQEPGLGQTFDDQNLCKLRRDQWNPDHFFGRRSTESNKRSHK